MSPKPSPKRRQSRRKPLTPLEWEFVAEYVTNGCNAVRAYLAIRPNTSYSSAKTLAARLLKKVDLRKAVEREQRRRVRKSGVHAERVLDEWGHIAFAHIGEVLDLTTLTLRRHIPAETLRAVASTEVATTGRGRNARTSLKVRMHDKVAALDRLTRRMGLYRELPPLETVLALMPPKIADALREEFARGLPAGGSQLEAAEDVLPEWARPVPDAIPGDGMDVVPEGPFASGDEGADEFTVGGEPGRA